MQTAGGAGTPRVAVVIPHHERLADTAACCASLAAQTHRPAAVLVVDNASQSHTEAALAVACPGARVLRLDANRGFAGGVNAGLRSVLTLPDVAFVWVLNNDTVCPPETLARLLACAAGDARIGLVGCPLREGGPGAPQRVVPAGRMLLRPWCVPCPARAGREPDYLTGASLLLRRELLEALGGFDEGYFFFFEDVDLSLRARRGGWTLAVAADALVRHTGSATIGGQSERQARFYRAGHVRLLCRHSRFPLVAALPPFLFRLGADLFRGRGAAVRGNWSGWRQGWRAASEREGRPDDLAGRMPDGVRPGAGNTGLNSAVASLECRQREGEKRNGRSI